jgi:hypothetical protein
MTKILWKLPFPSSGAWTTQFRELPRRECAIDFPKEPPNVHLNYLSIVFSGVEAYKCTYFNAITPVPEASDTLIDIENSEWLASIRERMATHGADTSQLQHLMIDFDDGPSYEFICRSFRVERPVATDTEP